MLKQFLTKEKMKKILLGLILVAIIGGGCSYLNSMFGMRDDNIIEEAAEAFLEKETGLDIDFTPSSPEAN